MGLNRYPLWKNILIALVVCLSVIYALPILYGDDPAVQISTITGDPVGEEVITQIKEELVNKNITVKAVNSEENGSVLFRLNTQQQQLEARETVQSLLGNDYIAALNLAPATPNWLRAIGGSPMKLGLDLRGGVHFVMEVDVASAVGQRERAYVNELRNGLRQEKIRYNSIRENKPNGLTVRARDAEAATQIRHYIKSKYTEFQFIDSDDESQNTIKLRLSDAEIKAIRDYAVEQTMTTLRNRVNELGVAEAVVQRQGRDRIVVQLPGVQDTARAKEILGKAATLEFLLVDEQADVNAALQGQIPAGTRLIYDETGRPYLFKSQVILSGESIVGARTDFDEYGKPAVAIRVGGSTGYFTKVTGENKGKLMGTIFKETRFEDQVIGGETRRVKKTVEKAISVATIRSALPNRFQISNIGTPNDARNLALLLRAGALPAPSDIIEERTIGPSLGADNIRMGMNSIIGGLALVLVFMACYYRTFGLIANVALLANLVMLVAAMSAISATLTLPGIAGIVLTLGMAVDANVLIFERIREEIRRNVSPQSCIQSGFEKAFATIMDANITTFIAAMVLFTIGSGPIKGFAVTLTIGLITSVFTAVMVSRAIVNLVYGGRKVKRLSIGI